MLKTLSVALLAFVCLAVHTSEADIAYDKAMASLRDAEADHAKLVPAIRLLGEAQSLFEKGGDSERAITINSCLYWAKKKLTLADTEALKPMAEVVKRLETASAPAPVSQAKTMLERADKFAKSHATDHMSIAVQYFEIADRFPTADEGRHAMSISLAEMQKVSERKQKVELPVADKGTILAIPGAPDVATATASVRDIYKNDYGTPESKANLALALIGQAENQEPAMSYAMLVEAKTLAEQTGEALSCKKAIVMISKRFGIPKDVGSLARCTKNVKTPEQIKVLFETYIALCDESLVVEDFTSAEIFAKGAVDIAREPALASKAKSAYADVKLLKSEYDKVKKAFETIKTQPDNEQACSDIGRYYCFVKGDWDRGLKYLANGNDAALSAIAGKEASAPTESHACFELGESWLAVAQRYQGVQRISALNRSSDWLRKVPAGNGIEEIKARKKLEENLSKTPTFYGKWDISDSNLILTKTAGRKSGDRGNNLVDVPAIIIGFRYEFNGKYFGGLQPIYMSADNKRILGKALGSVSQKAKEIIAKDGYAVGGVIAEGDKLVMALQIVFMRIEGNRLNPNDTYKSEWFLKQGSTDLQTLGCTGEFIVGTHGWAGTCIDSLGLIIKKY